MAIKKTSTNQSTQQAAKSSTTSKRKPTTKKSAAKRANATPSSKTAKQRRWGFEAEGAHVAAPTGAADQQQAPEAKPEAPPSPTSTVNGDGDQLVVFAIRLTRAERDTIHEAAGSGKASKFVRGVALAAARGDRTALQDLLSETHEKAH